MRKAIWSVGLLLEPSPGSNVSQAIKEAIEFRDTMRWQRPAIHLVCNGILLSIDEHATEESLNADYNKSMSRAR